MDLQQFGKKLRSLRQQAGWSQEVLIEALDQLARSGPPHEYRVLDSTLLSRWERAHTQKGRTWKPTRTYLLYLIQLFAPHLDLALAQAWAEQAGYKINAAELQAWFPTLTDVSHEASANAQFQPTDQAQAAAVVPHNLPTLLTSFVGRESEIARVLDYLATLTTRLITVVGEGGAGKTRLALEVAHQVVNQGGDQYRDGVYFVALVGVSTASFVVSALANTLGLALVGADDPQQQLLAQLQKRRLLLVLDNFEQLVAEATFLLTAILQAAPGVHLLVTSRERLNLAEEWVLLVAGLPFPTGQVTAAPTVPLVPRQPAIGTTAAYSAIELFLTRGRQADAQFDPVDDPNEIAAIARICELIQGIPLGIEIAAAWVHIFSCCEISDEIARNLDFLTSPHRNVPERHRSMRAVFEHSWRLLTELEQSALAVLAVFQGGFTREAAASVAKASLLTLRSLVDKSLLKVAEGRYELHELLRQFAYEKLQVVPHHEQLAQARHSQYYGDFLQQMEPLWDSPQGQSAVTQVKEEIRNIRSGWQWAVTHQRPVLLEKYIPSFVPFYAYVSWLREGQSALAMARVSLTQALSQARLTEAEVYPCLVKAMVSEAFFERFLGEPKRAMQLLQKSLEILQTYPNPREKSLAYTESGLHAYNRGDYSLAYQHLQQSLAIHATLDEPNLKANVYGHLGEVAMALGQYDDAGRWYQMALEIYQRLEKAWGIANALFNLGRVADLLDKNEQAEQCYTQSLHIFLAIDNSTGSAKCFNRLGVLAQKQADYVVSQNRHQQSLALYQKTGEKKGLILTSIHLSDVAYALGDERTAVEHLRTAFNLSTQMKAAPLLMQTLLSGVKLLSTLGQRLTERSATNETAWLSPVTRTAFVLLSLVAQHPASDYHTHQQAKSQLSDLIALLPTPIVQQWQQQIQANTSETPLTTLFSQELAELSFVKEIVLFLEDTSTNTITEGQKEQLE